MQVDALVRGGGRCGLLPLLGRLRYAWCGHQQWPGWVERLLGALMTPFGKECYCRPNPLQFFKWGRKYLEWDWRRQLAGGRPRGAWRVSDEYYRAKKAEECQTWLRGGERLGSGGRPHARS